MAIVLVVERNDLVRESIASMVAALGHVVHQADSTGLVESVLSMFQVDVVMTSWGSQSTLDGIEVARYARSVSPGTWLILTAGSVREEGHARHFDAYLQKPFSLDALRKALDRGSAA
jgi:CheY-like chemotaxis protein